MAFRSWTPDAYSGYGVSNKEVDVSNADIEHSIIDILANADIPSVRAVYPFPNDIAWLMVTVQWRVVIRISAIDYSRVKIYDGRTTKSKLGTFVIGCYDYFAGDGFISYQNFISELHNASFLLRLSDNDIPEIPCTEPPLELGTQPADGNALFPYTQQQTSTFARSGYAFAGNPSDRIGDSFSGYMEEGVQSWLSAMTYICSCVPYTQAEYDTFFPRYLLL